MSTTTISLLSVPEAAQALHVASVTVWRNIKAGTLSYVRVGRRVLLRQSDLAAFIESCAVSARKAG